MKIVQNVFDLVAVGAITARNHLFWHVLDQVVDLWIQCGRLAEKYIENAMETIYNFLENMNECQFSKN